MPSSPKDIKADYVKAGFRVEIYTGQMGTLVRVLGSLLDYDEVGRIARRHGANWVSDAPDLGASVAALGYPTRAA